MASPENPNFIAKAVQKVEQVAETFKHSPVYNPSLVVATYTSRLASWWLIFDGVIQVAHGNIGQGVIEVLASQKLVDIDNWATDKLRNSGIFPYKPWDKYNFSR